MNNYERKSPWIVGGFWLKRVKWHGPRIPKIKVPVIERQAHVGKALWECRTANILTSFDTNSVVDDQ